MPDSPAIVEPVPVAAVREGPPARLGRSARGRVGGGRGPGPQAGKGPGEEETEGEKARPRVTGPRVPIGCRVPPGPAGRARGRPDVAGNVVDRPRSRDRISLVRSIIGPPRADNPSLDSKMVFYKQASGRGIRAYVQALTRRRADSKAYAAVQTCLSTGITARGLSWRFFQ